VKYSSRLGYSVHTELDKQGADTLTAGHYLHTTETWTTSKQKKIEANKGWAVTSQGMDGLEVCQHVLTTLASVLLTNALRKLRSYMPMKKKEKKNITSCG